ncbi:glutathione synthetase, putative [Bodo saltans]|uniref:Glutathione synthetase n=1 Tax=Bodo saltans TaxID=75058 RepID=A0A0S4J7U4_BODSA|nr:glutathione synthetase, putative [Bodo saltans]|eukprot:CUG84905.1 glutathione synthetase, putative [Bodo saltans]
MTSKSPTTTVPPSASVSFVTEEELVAKCITSGLVIRKAPNFTITHPPITLRPLCVSRKVFTEVTELQTVWNILVDTISRDISFLTNALAHCAASDVAFTGRLLEIAKRIYGDSTAHAFLYQQAMLGVFRTDYMEDGRTKEWKNVEINTISVSFAGLAPRANAFHEYVAKAERVENPQEVQPEIRRGLSDVEIPLALAETHAYVVKNGFVDVEQGCAVSQQIFTPVVVFVIQENERNTGDQFLLSTKLLEAHGVRSVRRTMTQLSETMRLLPCAVKSTQGSTLRGLAGEPPVDEAPAPPPCAVFDNFVATVFYFRCAYVPSDFINEKCWEAREAMERSSAVKAPSLPHHLVGFKKIQQLLCDPSILRRYTSEESAVRLSKTFMGQYSLDPTEERHAGEPSIDALIADAAADPRKYVLKPQLEGGGNLVAGAALVATLQLPESDPMYHRIRNEYILMERIPFHARAGTILKEGVLVDIAGGLCSELGVFGTILCTSPGVVSFNRSVGTLVRTKPADVDDGGVMAGVAALDSLAIEGGALSH